MSTEWLLFLNLAQSGDQLGRQVDADRADEFAFCFAWIANPYFDEVAADLTSLEGIDCDLHF